MTQLNYAIALAWFAFGPVHGGDLDLPAPAAVEPLEEEHLYAAPTRPDRIGRIAAPVMINGQGPFRLILDTGASRSVITTRVANTLGLLLTPESRLMLHGVTGSLAVPAVRLDS